MIKNTIIELKNVTKKYGPNHKTQVILENLSFSFEQGLTTSILGASGCGKTTLLNLIGGIDSEFDGELLFNGMPIQDFDKYRRENISFIFQNLNLISHHNLIKNITIGLTNDVEDKEAKALELLKRVGLFEHADKKPHQLSGGERQRVAIARALARETDVLLCDEPTGSLDEETKHEIMDLIVDIFKDKTIIIITHDDELAEKYSDVILNIENKKLEVVHHNKADLLLPIHDSTEDCKKDKTFNNRFIINLLSNKKSLFNASYLIIIISAIFLFGIGIVKGVENEIDNFLYDQYKTDKILVQSPSMTIEGFQIHVNDFNQAHNIKIKGIMTGLHSTTTFMSNNESRYSYLVSLQPGIKENITPDITFGRFPEKNNEILYSKGAARQKIFDDRSMSIETEDELKREDELNRLFDWLIALSDEELFHELTAIDLSYKNTSVHNDKREYNNDLKIVGIIDDDDYHINIEFTEERLTHFKKWTNYNFTSKLSVEHNGEEKSIYVNNNIYMLEEEFLNYISDVYIGANGVKFRYYSLFIDNENLDLRDNVFKNFLFFKTIFRGNDYIIEERELYYSHVHGYKVAIIAACILLAIFAAISIFNGIKTNIDRNRNNIGIYKSLGYSSKDIKKMFAMEGMLIALFVSLCTLVVWFIINLIINQATVNALDPNRILVMRRIIYLDIYSLLGVALAIVSIILFSISKELKKVNIINLIK
ncbi:ABC transporter ATP-binding protein/permease [Alkaliphilus serpentinus]|nr:ATP-binding cassette domain-containing protein [Alkaliphilus serpentinus]